MRMKLEGITILADDVLALAYFYRDVLGFEIVIEENHYAEFSNSGIRVAICARWLMADNTDGHASFIEKKQGQAFELNFECDTPERVHELFQQFVAKGATAIAEPTSMSWGHTAGFFADPEGNIHSLFAVNPTN